MLGKLNKKQVIPVISIKNVQKIFPSKQGQLRAVDDVNLEIQEGEIFGVIGYSGAGKSTLIRMLNGLELPTDGTVTIADRVISKIKGAELRKARQEISMIFQHFNLLWSRTVSENIAFPLEIAGIKGPERQKRVSELIKLVGLEGRENAYPSQLSGGQKQRVGIARALANNPKVLLCDEATSALDPQTTDSILELLVDINKRLGLTIVLITHEMHVIRKICHQVAVMESGRVVELGPVLDVFKNPQQPITKRFVQQVTEPEETKETTQHLLELYPHGQVVQLSFIGEATEHPLITNVIRNFDVVVNILQGKISHTQNGSYGTLFIHLDGQASEIQNAIDYIHSQQVGVEVISNG
ncbi:methionine ABC transporter ATP-binding protein [Neobacillus drentensis]|uniref:methionine ABC transporter ATP-binding protein n=1 Tax=Neobacillus drentensis TaxID=220684 RepID=UPI003AACF2BB